MPRMPAQGPGHGGPAKGKGRGNARKDFQPGHAVRLTHGAEHAATVDPLARELVALTLTDPQLSYLAEARYTAELQAWARAEVQVRLIEKWLAEHGGPLDEEGDPRSATTLLGRAEERASRARHALGLTPMAAAKLGRDVASTQVDLARLWAVPDSEGA